MMAGNLVASECEPTFGGTALSSTTMSFAVDRRLSFKCRISLLNFVCCSELGGSDTICSSKSDMHQSVSPRIRSQDDLGLAMILLGCNNIVERHKL